MSRNDNVEMRALIDQRTAVVRLARTTRRIVQIVALLLVSLYGWLKLQDVPVGAALGSVSADVIVRISLVIYFVSWIYGVIFEINEQESAYTDVPGHGKFPMMGYGAIASMTLLFAILCYVSSGREFAVTLAAFLAVNILGWRYIVRPLVKKAVSASKAAYTESRAYFALFNLEQVNLYFTARWQWHRFAYGGLLVLIINVLTFNDVLGGQTLPYSVPTEIILSFAILIYVVTFEGWIWYYRLRLKLVQNAIRDSFPRFEIMLRSDLR